MKPLLAFIPALSIRTHSARPSVSTRNTIHQIPKPAPRMMFGSGPDPSLRQPIDFPSQEHCWDYPRPPSLLPCSKPITITVNNTKILHTTNSFRILETYHPPTYYMPKDDFVPGVLVEEPGLSSFCEFKGAATYYSLHVDGKVYEAVAWSYENPSRDYMPIKGYVAMYAGKVEGMEVVVDGIQARPQPGGFYGGWVTNEKGPFKGEPGTNWW